MDCSLPGSSIRGILQAKILEWVAIPFSRESSWPRDQTWVSCIAGELFTVCATREGNLSSMCLPNPLWEGGRDSVNQEETWSRRAGVAKCCSFNLLSGDCLSVDCMCVSCCFLGGGEEDVGRGAGSRSGLGVGRLLRGVGVGRGCKAARVLCVPEVQVWLGGMECSLLPSKSRNSCGRAWKKIAKWKK